MDRIKLDSDQSEYISQASVEIAKEQSFKPQSEKDLADWMEKNHQAILERAISNQRNLLTKVLGDRRILDELSTNIMKNADCSLNSL